MISRSSHHSPTRARLGVVLCGLVLAGATGCPGEENKPKITVSVNNTMKDMSPSDMSDMGGTGDMSDMPTTDMPADMSDMCVPESDEDFCKRINILCGPAEAMDNCGVVRKVDSCGEEAVVCPAGEVCNAGQCECIPKTCESEGVLCGTLDTGCGMMVECDLFCVDNISIGAEYGCAVGSGKVKCWGKNGGGQLGTNNTTKQKNPTDVVGLMPYTNLVSAGGEHSCVVLASGDATCWGQNGLGQLGNGTTVDTKAPDLTDANNVIFSGSTKQIVAGDEHTCALIDEDTTTPFSEGFAVKCWGTNQAGIIGDPALMINANVSRPRSPRIPNPDNPGFFKDFDGVIQLAAGPMHTCALKADRTVWCWGLNDYNQVGNREIHTDQHTSLSYPTGRTYIDNWHPSNLLPAVNMPTKVVGVENVAFIASGEKATCAVKTDNTVWCWGTMTFKHARDTCKDGYFKNSPDAKRCAVWPPSVQATEANGVYPLVIQTHMADGTPRWETTAPHIGKPTISSLLTQSVASKPLQVLKDDGTPLKALRVAMRREHMCVVIDEPDTSKTNVWCMGNNESGQVGDGTSSSPGFPLPVIDDNDGGPVRAKMPDAVDAADPEKEEKEFKASLLNPVSLGNDHSCVHNVDNSIKCWGSNKDGQIGNEDLMNDASYKPFRVKLRFVAP